MSGERLGAPGAAGLDSSTCDAAVAADERVGDERLGAPCPGMRSKSTAGGAEELSGPAAAGPGGNVGDAAVVVGESTAGGAEDFSGLVAAGPGSCVSDAAVAAIE